MRRLFTIAALAIAITTSAQNLPSIAVGVLPNGEYVETPSSTIIVDLNINSSEFKAGIYAKYAKRFLGERAQLTDKNTVEIKGCEIGLAPSGYFVGYEPQPSTTQTRTPELPIDRLSATMLTAEQAAQNAADHIFANRQTINDLIAGDVGEAVFGAGLTTALERFDNIEREYLALFMGQESIENYSTRFIVNVESDRKRYMICRFDPQKGITPASDIDGEPVYLQITPSEVADKTVALTTSKDPAKQLYIVPNRAQCDLYVGADIIYTIQLPLYDFGQRVTILSDKK